MRGSHAVLTDIRLDEDSDAWASVGFDVRTDDGDPWVRLGGITVHFDPAGQASIGFDRDVAGSFGDLNTHVTGPPAGPPTAHPNGVDGIDHVVIATSDLDEAIEGLSAPELTVRRVRDTTLAGRPAGQAFVVAGSAVIEIVSGLPDSPAGHPGTRVWGIAATATDLDACHRFWGERCSAPRPAVQPGRRIMTVHLDDPPSAYTLAAMSPRPTKD